MPTTDADTDPGAVADFYAATYRRLVGILALAAGDTAVAHDVVQEALVRLLPRWSSVGRYDDPEAWVRQVAFRLLSNHRRWARRWSEPGDADDLGSGGSAAAATPGPSGDSVDVARALSGLNRDQRCVVVLHHLLDLPVDAVATELGVAVGTARSRLSRARAALAPLLAEEATDRV